MARAQCHTPLVSVASNFHFMRSTSANSKLLFNPHQHGTKATPIFRSQLDVNYTQNYIHPKGRWSQTILTCPKFFADDTIFCMWSDYGNLVANAIWKFACRLFCSNVSIIFTSSHSKLTLENWIQGIQGLQMLQDISHFHWSCDMSHVNLRQTLKKI
jgi:hypothetical protein